jgi:hypothetical protein
MVTVCLGVCACCAAVIYHLCRLPTALLGSGQQPVGLLQQPAHARCLCVLAFSACSSGARAVSSALSVQAYHCCDCAIADWLLCCVGNGSRQEEYVSRIHLCIFLLAAAEAA